MVDDWFSLFLARALMRAAGQILWEMFLGWSPLFAICVLQELADRL